jgi:hypothetical protein
MDDEQKKIVALNIIPLGHMAVLPEAFNKFLDEVVEAEKLAGRKNTFLSTEESFQRELYEDLRRFTDDPTNVDILLKSVNSQPIQESPEDHLARLERLREDEKDRLENERVNFLDGIRELTKEGRLEEVLFKDTVPMKNNDDLSVQLDALPMFITTKSMKSDPPNSIRVGDEDNPSDFMRYVRFDNMPFELKTIISTYLSMIEHGCKNSDKEYMVRSAKQFSDRCEEVFKVTSEDLKQEDEIIEGFFDLAIHAKRAS